MRFRSEIFTGRILFLGICIKFYLFQLLNARPVWLMTESLLYSRSTIRKPKILELSTSVSFPSISHKSARMWSTSHFRRIFLDGN